MYRGYKSTVAEQRLAAFPAEVDVHYNPADPKESYLQLQRTTNGIVITAGGCVGLLGGLIALVA